MGLFDKKYCDICEEKIGLLGNRKLEDGNLCKNCAKKLSPFFSERRHSTVDEIRGQLAYREENRMRLDGFHPDRSFGRNEKVYIDTASGAFIVSRYSDWRDENPDLISLSQVIGCDTDVREHREEQYYKDSEGNRKRYEPPRYEYDYSFHITIQVDSPWFSEIDLELSEGRRPDSRYSQLYHDYETEMYELSNALTRKYAPQQTGFTPSQNYAQKQPVQQPAYTVAQTANGWSCSCGTVNKGKFCMECGSPKPAGAIQYRCDKCGWEPEEKDNTPRFCPQCGDVFGNEDIV